MPLIEIRTLEDAKDKKQIPPPQAAEDRSLRVGMTIERLASLVGMTIGRLGSFGETL